MDAGRVVFSHRMVTAAGGRYHVLSRTASAGADYTGRTNHLAHHLILPAEEAAQLGNVGVSPADVLLRFPWRAEWDGAPEWLEEGGTPRLETLPRAGDEASSAWMQVTGSAASAALLVSEPGVRGSVIVAPPRLDLRCLYAESLRPVAGRGWQYTFTTELDPGEDAGDFRWVGLPADSPLLASFLPGRRLLLDLTDPATLPSPVAVPEKARTPAAAPPARQAPPRVVAPAGGSTFQEPEPAPPPPPLAARKADPAPAPAVSELSRPRSNSVPRARSSGGKGPAGVAVVLLFVVALAVMRFLSTPRQAVEDPSPEPLAHRPEAAPAAAKASSADTPVSPAPGGSPIPATSSVMSPQAPAPVLIPLLVIPAPKLSSLELPDLRVGQVHLLTTSSGEERGPLSESRNGLWVSMNDKSPTLKVDYAARRAEWTAAPGGAVSPPVQWRILQDNREVFRVLIGGGGNQRPVNPAAVRAVQDESGVIGGDFASLVRRLGSQSLWLRLPTAVGSLLKECGHEAPAIVPIYNFKADTSDLISWVVKEQAQAVSQIGRAPGEPPLTFPAQTQGEFSGTTAPLSSRTNRLGDRPAPTSSVAANEETRQAQLRVAAQLRLAKLATLRAHPVLQGRLTTATFSFFVGPAGSSPADSVWVCDVTFPER